MWKFLPSSSPGRCMKYTHTHTHTPENYNLIPLLPSKPQQICAFILSIWHLIFSYLISKLGFPDSSAGKESTCNVGDLGLIPGLGRCPGGGHGNPHQYSCLENPHGQRSLAAYSPGGHKESNTTERWSTAQHIEIIFRSHLTSLSLTFKRKGSDETIAEISSSSNTSHLLLCFCDLHKKGPG